MNKLIVALFLCMAFGLSAKPKKHNFAVCGLFKNEEKHLREWIEYHRMIGVDHFYLYDNGSTDRYMSVLRPLINQKVVTLCRWPDLVKKEESLSDWVLSTQIPAYENAIVLHAKKEANWITFLDVNEFLVPINQDSITDVLKAHEKEAGITVLTECFDASGERETIFRKLVIEAEDLTKDSERDLRESVEKMIFKPEFYAGSSWAPYQCQLKGGKKAKEISENSLRINQYERRDSISKKKKKLYLENDHEKTKALDAGFNVDDSRRSIQRFIPELLKRI